MARVPHGLLRLHGLTQARLMQACVGGHMESDVQPISTGSPKIVVVIKKIYKIEMCHYLLIRSHLSSPLPVYPGLQVHTITLSGSSFFTSHSAF